MSPWPLNVYMDAVIRGENGDRKERSEIHGGGERMEKTWPLVCRRLGSVW